jgi:hypothetical protein
MMELWQSRTGRKGWNLYQGRWGLLISLAISLMINSAAASLVSGVVGAGERTEAEKSGQMVVDPWFIVRVRQTLRHMDYDPTALRDDRARLEYYYDYESSHIAAEYGANPTRSPAGCVKWSKATAPGCFSTAAMRRPAWLVFQRPAGSPRCSDPSRSCGGLRC